MIVDYSLQFISLSYKMKFISGKKWWKVVMSMFMGEFNHTIDAKGRLIIPSRFREELGQEFVMTKGLDGCLFVFPQNEWESFQGKLKTLPLINKDVLTGMADRIEIWSKEKWIENNSYEDMDDIAASMQELGLSI